MTCSWRWFIHPETAINKNRNGSSTLCVKTHYLDRRAAVAKYRIFMQIQFSDHTGGLRAVVAESALTRHQILILNRSRKRAPNRRASDRLIAGFCTLLMHPSRLRRCGMVLKPSTLLHFHHAL